MQCRCPNCRLVFDCSSADFGKSHTCSHCGYTWDLKPFHLVRYRLPKFITIRVFDDVGSPFRKFPVPVLVNYGFPLPPLLTDVAARVMVTTDMILKARNDALSTDIMGKRDYAANRYIIVVVPDRAQGTELAKTRKSSGLSIRPYEKELYGDLYTLCAAYVPVEDVMPVKAFIDLATEETEINLPLTIMFKD